MNEELKRKLAEWAGVQPEKIFEHPGYYLRYPDFPHSLDACFKWLIPKCLERKWKVNISWSGFPPGKPHATLSCWDARYVKKSGGGGDIRPHINAIAEQPALALCMAVEKLIDSEGK